ncbi:MAG: hypothetical protein MUC62_04515 [Candidatus Thermoplasmatota archaeon]|nr:hypothetical protein [Candidatus Thermoplasmatota archaeon]
MSLFPGTKCGACGSAPEKGRISSFCGVPVCSSCSEALDLGSLGPQIVPTYISDLISKEGNEAASGLVSLASRMPRDEGWKLLSNIHGMTLSIKDPPSKELLRGSLILVGASVIFSGTPDEGPALDIKALTLALVLGEVLCLSMMKRISRENALTSSGRLDDVLITAFFRSDLSKFLLSLRQSAVGVHENELASAVWTLVG